MIRRAPHSSCTTRPIRTPTRHDPAAARQSPRVPKTLIDVDVLVIGGGPAGTTAATLLARKGRRVLLLEKDSHPRFHIGESLLPMNLPILERLGVLEQVRAIGTYKPGAEFPIVGDDRPTAYNTFRFERAIDPQFGYAYQVKREEFDQLLFEHARANGVDARERVKVETHRVRRRRPPGRWRIARDADGSALRVRTRYLVDASGRDTLLRQPAQAQAARTRCTSRRRSSATSPASSAARARTRGNITVQRFAHGWMWLIPLQRDVMSIGAVCFPEYLKQRRGENEAFLMQTLRVRAVSVATRMQQRAARRAGARHRQLLLHLHAHDRPGLGDGRRCLCLRRSGVLLRRLPGHEQRRAGGRRRRRRAARSRARSRAADARWSARLKRGLKHFQWFIYRFNTPVMQHLFNNPRNVWQVEQAVISMLAGDVFDNPRCCGACACSARSTPSPRCSWRRRRSAAGCGAGARSA